MCGQPLRPACSTSLRGRGPAHSHSPPPLPLTSSCHFGAWTASEWTCPPFRRLCPGRWGLRHPEVSRGRLLHSDTFVLLPPLSRQHPPPPSLLALTRYPLLPPLPLGGLWPPRCPSRQRAEDGWGPLPAATRSPACHPAPSPAHAPRRAVPRTILPSVPSPLPLPSAPRPSVWGVRRDLPARSPPSHLLPHPLPSLFPSSLRSFPLTHPLPLPLPPSLSPTSLFQRRTGSSGQFPHCSASGAETAPPR